jgi:hypothetical protein
VRKRGHQFHDYDRRPDWARGPLKTVPAPPDPRASGPQWNSYVAEGDTKAERKARLEACPEALRAGVESHVRTVFALRAKANAKAEAEAANPTPVPAWRAA